MYKQHSQFTPTQLIAVFLLYLALVLFCYEAYQTIYHIGHNPHTILRSR